MPNRLPPTENGSMAPEAPYTTMDHHTMVAEPEENMWVSLGFLWRRLWIVVLFVVVGLGLGYLYFQKQPPRFESSGTVLIVEMQPRLPMEAVSPDARFNSQIHSELIRSPAIIERAIEKHDLRKLESLKSGNAVDKIRSGLQISTPLLDDRRGGSDKLLRFAYSSENRDDCRAIVTAMIDTYEEFLDETYRDVSREAIDLITQAKDQLDRELSAQEKAYREFRHEAPLLLTQDGDTNVHDTRLGAIEKKRSELVLENTQLRSEIDGLQAALRRGGNREALNYMIGHMEQKKFPEASKKDPDHVLFPMMLEEHLLLEQFGPEHPKVAELRLRMKLTREFLASDEQQEEEEPQDFYEIYLDSLREKIALNEQIMAGYDELFQQERDATRQLITYHDADQTFRSEIARKQRLFDAVLSRLEEISLVQDAGGVKTQLVHPPRRAVQIAPNFRNTMLLASVLSLLSGMGLAYIVDSADRRFRSPNDVRNYLGLPLIGHVPVLRYQKSSRNGATDSTLQESIVAHYQPRSRAAEAYRAVRTSLYFSDRGADYRVIQVTSPHVGDGKTTMACNLAVSIAQSGKRVLLIDCDFRRPQVHHMFGLSNDVGVSSVIAGKAEVADAIQQTEAQKLWLMVCGPRPGNPAELLTSPRFERLLEMLREKFDYVIIDSPPILAVSDPAAVAARADGVLMVMRLSKNARESALRARELLDSLGANCLGIVINAVGGTAGGYVYGRTSYGYGYGYGDKKYYTEDEPVGAGSRRVGE